jgi:hypothetical protein
MRDFSETFCDPALSRPELQDFIPDSLLEDQYGCMIEADELCAGD